MYCPRCGAEAIDRLNYCKHCGTNLNLPAGEAERKTSVSMFALVPPALVSIVGLIGLFVTIVHLSHRGLPAPFLVGVAAIAGATVFGVVGMFIWLLLRLTGNSLRPGRELPTPQQPLQMPAAHFDRSSVTENTTRNFDPVYKNRGVRDTGS